MTRAIKQISRSKQAIPTAFTMLLFVVFFAAVFYIYFVTVTITKAVNNEQVLSEMSRQEHQNTELEKRYINLIGALDIDYAHKNGFVNQEEKIVYVARQNILTQR